MICKGTAMREVDASTPTVRTESDHLLRDRTEDALNPVTECLKASAGRAPSTENLATHFLIFRQLP